MAQPEWIWRRRPAIANQIVEGVLAPNRQDEHIILMTSSNSVYDHSCRQLTLDVSHGTGGMSIH